MQGIVFPRSATFVSARIRMPTDHGSSTMSDPATLSFYGHRAPHSLIIWVLFACFLLSATVGAAQSVIRFDDVNGAWHVAHSFPQGSQEHPDFVATSSTLYTYSGDTVINGETWQRMYSTGTSSAAVPMFRGLVRQAGQLVLFGEPGFPVDTVYNFGLQVGMAMPFGRAGSNFRDTLTVEAIDLVQIENVTRRVFRFSSSTLYMSLESYLSDTWIEGIGSLHGPLAPLSAGALEDPYASGIPDSTRLTCYARNGTLLWRHNGYPACAVNIQQSMDGHATNSFKVYPIPAKATINVEGGPSGAATVSLLDLLGQLVMRRSVSGPNWQLNTSMVEPGSYCLLIETDGTPLQQVRVLIQ